MVPRHQAGFPPSMSLTLVSNRISLLLFHVLPHASQAVSLYKLKWTGWWPKVDDEEGEGLCVVCVLHENRAGGERDPVFVVMGVSVILQVQARNKPHTECLSINVCLCSVVNCHK